ncbi:MAG: UDP-N-acetylmuramoyl-L-alanine--D-glutamate ligase, partial [Patescibacteria group bacterium]
RENKAEKDKVNMNYIDFFRGKRITVMGLGILGRGIGVAKFLAKCGAKLTITDLKTKKELQPALKKLKKFKNIKYILGRHRLTDFRNKDMIIKAAGVPLDSPYIKEAKKNKIPVEMDASLFIKVIRLGSSFSTWKPSFQVKIIGITGTRGKSTTTQLIYEILKRSGKRVFLGGNVKGLATLPLLKKVRPDDIVVMELDSWQLQGFGEAKISPRIAVFTNFMRDHMNYYKKNMGRYFNNKANIFKYQKEGDFLITGEKINKILKKFYKSKIKSKVIIAKKGDITKRWKVKLIGDHNLENIAAAIAACGCLGVSDAVIKKAVENFSGVSGRLEFIGETKGVKYYNDTTATTPEATMVALNSLKENKGKIILIGGGMDKMLDYKNYAQIVKRSVKALILFKGAATDKIIRALGRIRFHIEIVDGMKRATEVARAKAKKGDLILLSPGAASFGVFKNEFDRGEQFDKLVKKFK